MTTETADFPIVWDDPSDAEKTWHFSPDHMPLPQPPLPFELVLAPFLRGFGWSMNPIQVNYYTFFSFDGPREANEPDKADVAYLQMAARRWHETILPEVLAYIEEYRTRDFDSLSDDELAQEIERLRDVRFRSGQLHTMSVTPYWLGHQLLVETYKELVADDELAALRLVQGYPNKSVEAGVRLWEVSRIAASIPAVRERLLESDDASALACYEELQRQPEAQRFVEAFRVYLDEFGWRAGGGVSGSTWIEDPTVPLGMMRTYLELADYDPIAEQQRLAEEREDAIAEAMSRLDEAQADKLRELLDAVRGISMLSEDHNFYIDQRLVTTPRRLMLAAGRRLQRKGLLDDADLVFFSRTHELVQALRGDTTSLQDMLVRRREELEQWRSIAPPQFIGAVPPAGSPAHPEQAVPAESSSPDEVRGMAASSGVARGTARVLTDLSEAERLRPGDVLVVPVTSPAWTPLFAIASAIVTEVGGVLGHTAIVAREYKLPAVVNVKNATRLLRDGDLIEVDGSAGVVRVLT